MLNTVADIHVQTSMIGKPGTVETHGDSWQNSNKQHFSERRRFCVNGRIASSIFQKEGAFV